MRRLRFSGIGRKADPCLVWRSQKWLLWLACTGISLSCGPADSGKVSSDRTHPDAIPFASNPSVKADSIPTAGRPLSTAEVVARCEPSVAVIVGRSSSGSGFLVKPGILATNAHVIDGEIIQDLEIRFPSAPEEHQGPFQADLISRDRQRDLAFLAVKTKLPPLEIARSYQFRKGDEMTVIGSPGVGPRHLLENAVSRGIMSTQTTLEGQPFYQLGLAVNPGNSGGPAIDANGRVIGVVTLKATQGEELTFCIPAEDLILGIEQATRQTPLETEISSAPRLVYQWVAGQSYIYRVHFKLEFDGKIRSLEGSSIYRVQTADDERIKLNHRGWLITRVRSSQAGPNDPGAITMPITATEIAMEIDPQGNVLGEVEGKLPLSLLGDLATLILEPLPDQPRISWQSSRTITLIKTETRSRDGAFGFQRPIPFGGFPGAFRPPSPGRFGPFGSGFLGRGSGEAEIAEIPAFETNQYRLEEDSKGGWRIIRTHELATETMVGDTPLLAATGEGITQFDLNLGLPRRVEYRGQIVAHEENVTLRIPLELNCELLEGADRSEAMTFPMLPPPSSLSITAEQLDQALRDLGSNQGAFRREAARRLANAKAIEDRRDEVAHALEAHLDDFEAGVNREAIHALGIWGVPRTRSLLISRLLDDSYDARRELVMAIGRLGPDPDSAEALADCLGQPGVDAGRALLLLGAEVAEPVLRSRVEADGPISLRVEACRLLGEIGTSKSLATLRALAGRQNSADLSRLARDAVQAIHERYPVEDVIVQRINDLRSANERLRYEATVQLSRIAPIPSHQEEVVTALAELLTEQNRDTQRWAVLGLETWGAEGVRQALIDRVNDPQFGPWREAVALLAKLNQPDQATAEAIAGRFDQDRFRVIEALKRLGPLAEVEAIRALEQHPNPAVRRDVCGLLAVVGTSRALSTLESIANDRSAPLLDSAARDAIQAIRDREGGEAAVRKLLLDLRSRDVFVRVKAIRLLASAQPTGAIRTEVVRALEDALDPQGAFGQNELYEALGILGDDQTLAVLSPLVSDPRNRFWRQALESLVKLGPDEAGWRAIIGRLKDNPVAIGKALQEAGALVEPFLLEAARSDPDPRNQAEACRLLASIGTPESLAILEPLAQTAELEPLTQAAAAAIRAIESRH